MTRRIASVVLMMAAMAACNRDKSAEVPVQQQSADSTPLTKAAPATKTAPAPARPPAPTPESAASAELARATSVRTVQVGAFPSAATAEWWMNELKRQGIPAYTTSATVGDAQVTRLRVGVALTAGEARAIADRIHARYKWPVWITVEQDKSPFTGAMLLSSRSYAAP